MAEVIQFIEENLPLILCLLSGAALLVVEVFMPRFGLPGISGLVLLIVGITLTWLHYGSAAGLSATLIALVLAGVSISASIRSADHGRLSRSALFLRRETPAPAEHEEDAAFLNREGTALTALNPIGVADFDGVRLEVVSQGEYLEKGVRVKVIAVEGAKIVVRPIAG